MKSSTTGKYTFLDSGEYGQMNGLDLVEGYMEGKLSPLAGAVRDEIKGKTFSGDEATAWNLFKQNATPLPFQSYEDLTKNDQSNIILFMLAEGLGFGVNTYGAK
jgi:hypothetical protein